MSLTHVSHYQEHLEVGDPLRKEKQLLPVPEKGESNSMIENSCKYLFPSQGWGVEGRPGNTEV